MCSHSRRVGNKGEDIATEWLSQQGFEILGRNYAKKWGEIDIVARGTTGIHFVEVKSVTREKKFWHSKDAFRPEDHVTREKILRLERTIETWLAEQRSDFEWQLDVVTVLIDPHTGESKCDLIEAVY